MITGLRDGCRRTRPWPRVRKGHQNPSDAPDLARPGNAAGAQADAELIGLVDKTDSSTIRTKVALNYREFTNELIQIAENAPTAEATALSNWATASEAQADYIDSHPPSPGDVIDYGPPHDQLTTAKQAAEKLCGRTLGP